MLILLCLKQAGTTFHIINGTTFRMQAMAKITSEAADPPGPAARAPQRKRADAQRKMASILQAALEVFTRSGVDSPVREIAERAGVGIGTMYRHFPQRSDLIVAVFQMQVDACAAAAGG